MTPKLTSILRLCTTVVTALLLALVAQDATISLLDEHDRTPSTFVIQALPKDGESAEDASQELWIEAIVADGQLLRWNSVQSSGNWQVVDKKGFWLPPFLLYKGMSQPGFLTFQGKSFCRDLKCQSMARHCPRRAKRKRNASSRWCILKT